MYGFGTMQPPNLHEGAPQLVAVGMRLRLLLTGTLVYASLFGCDRGGGPSAQDALKGESLDAAVADLGRPLLVAKAYKITTFKSDSPATSSQLDLLGAREFSDAEEANFWAVYSDSRQFQQQVTTFLEEAGPDGMPRRSLTYSLYPRANLRLIRFDGRGYVSKDVNRTFNLSISMPSQQLCRADL